MEIPDARQFLGRLCAVTYCDRRGDEVTTNLRIHDITFIPFYGAYLIGDIEDVCLTKPPASTAWSRVDSGGNPACSFRYSTPEIPKPGTGDLHPSRNALVHIRCFGCKAKRFNRSRGRRPRDLSAICSPLNAIFGGIMHEGFAFITIEEKGHGLFRDFRSECNTYAVHNQMVPALQIPKHPGRRTTPNCQPTTDNYFRWSYMVEIQLK